MKVHNVNLTIYFSCQFIVKDTGDYKQYLNNPDALVDWNLVEQVVSLFPIDITLLHLV